ncbi:hypothetical protein PC121_g1483 [Phytophthora cactorum]|nr:hypothetical protein PC120_g4 [Phytophthora cactorum]KAG3101413.1 hypothetical protein PC121_g1483 [Phytophthora cactorum]
MDQTAIFVDNPGKLTIDYRGTTKIDTIQGSSGNTGSCSVFLCGSATGEKLPPFVVFDGVPGCRVADSVTASTFGSTAVEHTVQSKAWCDHSIMKEWIEKIWCPNVNGCRMLLLDSLKVHKMANIRQYLENDCATQVQYIPPGVTGLSQPMDVSVMKSFKKKIQDLYVKHHIDHPFPADAAERRVMLSFLVAKAWGLVKAKTIVKGFRKAKLIPIGSRDSHGAFATYLQPLPDVSIGDEDEQ